MNQNEPMTPSYSWLKKVNDALFRDSEQAAKPRKPGIFYSIVPMRLRSSWKRDEETGLYKAKGLILSPMSKKEKLVDVYAPAAGSPPEGDPYEWTFYAVWRGRWETLQQPVEHKPYIAGDAISVGIYDSELGGIPIVNMGVCRAQIAGESRQETKTLYFSPIWFKWIPSSLDIAGKREIAINAKAVDVITKAPEIKITTRSIKVVSGIDSQGNPEFTYIPVNSITQTEATVEKIVVLKGATS